MVDKMITESAERGFSQTTQRKMLKMCFLKVKDLVPVLSHCLARACFLCCEFCMGLFKY